jgi:signal transduction histidine kinase
MLKVNRSPLSRYGVAVLASLLALLFRLLLEPILRGEAPLLVFILPVMVSAWYGGFLPGLVATGLSLLMGDYFFLPPSFSFGITQLSDGVRSGVFLVEGVLISVLSESLRHSRQRAEATAISLQQSEERSRLIVEGVQDYAIFMLDPNGRIASWNAGAERIKGYRAGEILGRHVSILYPAAALYSAASPILYPVADVDGSKSERELQTAVAEGRFINEDWQQRKDGSLFWASVVTTALRDKAGNLRGFSRITRDITERKQAEEALRRSAQRLAALHEIDRAILANELGGESIGAALLEMRRLVPCERAIATLFNFETNTAQILRTTAEPGEVSDEGVPLIFFLPTQILQQDSVQKAEYLSRTQTCPVSLIHSLTEQGACIRVPLVSDEMLLGELTLFLAVATAWNEEYQAIVTEVADQLAIAIRQMQLRTQIQQKAEELEQRVIERTAKLQMVNQELESFAYSISHDLRAPLRAIQGFAQAFLEDYGDRLDELGREYGQRILAAAARLDTLIQDLLAYSRVSRTDLRLQSINLTSLVEDVLAQLEPDFQERQAQVVVEKPLLSVLGHRSTLVQIISNLVENALKFVPPQTAPQVKIWTELRGEQVRLWVSDNGIGIAPQHQERIFKIFERLHGAEIYPGTGIGLAIVHKGVERMGGQTGLESEVGEGSRFWMELRRGT